MPMQPLHGSRVSLARSLSLASASIERVSQPEALQLLTAEEARQRFSFVPEVVFAIMLSVFANVEDLWPLLEVPWVRDWDGWKEAAMVLSSITDDGAETLIVWKSTCHVSANWCKTTKTRH